MSDREDFVYQPPMEPYITWIHKDDALIIIDKPSGLLSVPGRVAAHKDSAHYRLTRVYPEVTVVHRLDLATSGLLVFANSKPAQRHLSDQFAARRTHKRYFARVWGVPKQSTGVVRVPMSVDYPNRPLQKVDWQSGKPALTVYRVVSQDNIGALVELHPVTGRSHQLRVHMRELGHPILGDRLYAHDQARQAAPRLQLHAQAISLVHPLLGKRMSYACPIPFFPFTSATIDETWAWAKDQLSDADINTIDADNGNDEE